MADMLSFSFASTAITKNTVFMLGIAGIFLIIWMSFRAMSFPSVDCPKSVTSQSVFSMSNWFKMFRIYTSPIMAEMVKFFAFRNLLNRSLIIPAIGIDISPSFVGATTDREHSITIRPLTLPKPTAIRISFINKVQEAFFHCKVSARIGAERIYQYIHTAIITYQGGNYNR